MSRGDRASVTGILSSSMRNNYGEYGVAEYYKKVGSTYRNPHYPGVRLCIFSWLSKWWSKEISRNSSRDNTDVFLFDMACGSGEVTVAFHEWWTTCKQMYDPVNQENRSSNGQGPPTRKQQLYFIPLGPNPPMPLVVAADPFTSVAYKDRTSLPCATLSFGDIAEGELPIMVSDLSRLQAQGNAALLARGQEQEPNQEGRVKDTPHSAVTGKGYVARQETYNTIEMVVCSFALHLIENPSALFALLCTLSYKSRWLVVLAPHKKPEIKEGWGWEKWNVEEWRASPMSNPEREILFNRVHSRVYRSVNCECGSN